MAIMAIMACLVVAVPVRAQPIEASEQLRRAVDYFQSGKYHEAALLFDRLNCRYILNPRHRAFMAVCLYEEHDYAGALSVLDSIMPMLAPYSPQERAVYAFTAAESHFALGHYAEAAAYYESHLTLCHYDERGESLYRLGLCAMFQADYSNAYDRFISALAYFFRMDSGKASRQRVRQTEHLAAGCRDRMQGQQAVGVAQ